MDAPPSSVPPTAEQAPATATALKRPPPEWRVINGKEYMFPADFDQTRSLYRPHGKWAWAGGTPILTMDPGSSLGSGLEGSVDVKVGWIEDTEITYISKLTSVWDSWSQFLINMYLNASSKYLRPLQGDCVPWIIGIFNCNGGRIGVAQELPHPVGWREADMFLEEHQKEAIIAAYQKLHDRGICHGDVNYRHWIIGDDGRVTIIDFGFASVINPDQQARNAHISPCYPVAIREEMRKVKFMLNWKDSRACEYRLAGLRRDREEKDRAARQAWMPDTLEESLSKPKPLPEPVSEEERASPFPALDISDLDQWAYGDTFTARRFEVVRGKGHVTIKKTDIPRPPIPEQVKKDDPAPAPAPAPVSAATNAPPQETAKTPSEVQTPSHDVSVEDSEPEDQTRSPLTDDAPTPEMIQGGDSRETEAKETQPKPTVGKRSREDDVILEPEISESSKADDGEEHARKRQKSAEASTSTVPMPKGESPGNPVAPLDSGDSSLPRRSRRGLKRTTSSQTVVKPPEDRAFVPDPTPYDLTPKSQMKLTTEALQSWTRFTRAHTRAEALQQQLEEEKSNVERHRSDFLRKFLMLPSANRTSIWTELGEPDIRHLLGLAPDTRTSDTPPASSVLEKARLNLVKSTSSPRGLRILRQPKTHPRLTAIKRSEARPRVLSKLRQTAPAGSAESAYGSSSSESESESDDSDEDRDEPVAGPSPDLKAKLEHMEKYKEVVWQRAALEEEKHRATMPQPSSPQETPFSLRDYLCGRGSDDESSGHEPLAVSPRRSRVKQTRVPSTSTSTHTTAHNKLPIAQRASTTATADGTIVRSSTHRGRSMPVRAQRTLCMEDWSYDANDPTNTDWGRSPFADTPLPPDARAATRVTKRKREAALNENAGSREMEPDAKKTKHGPCGLM